jgi:hypothetical protein
VKEEVEIEGVIYTIIYQDTKIGDLVYDKNTKSTYEASIFDADDGNWIVQIPT